MKKLKIIADSGSTKTAWRLIHTDGSIHQESSLGLNPYASSWEDITNTLSEGFISKYKQDASTLFFYGSGMASPESSSKMKKVFEAVLPNAEVVISDDLTGAARASCGREPGIANILGTGSNSCLFDGEKIIQNIPTGGYILGDEGSGSYIGKILIGDFIRNALPEQLSNRLKQRFNLTRDDILENVYRKPQANKYLAQYAKFVFQNIKEPYCAQLVTRSFEQFFEKNICQYENYKLMPVHFTGSIAFYFSDYLRKVAKKYEINVKNILENPIAGLALYHQQD